ncbi:MAG: flagellar biosynthesis anti-sigma factor FlgM [Gammaproteobacteria bacterium]|nr:MAG: flagellar biosynthesis anti-sigma factor FlgM [Gammaproteobacteria bacterium]
MTTINNINRSGTEPLTGSSNKARVKSGTEAQVSNENRVDSQDKVSLSEGSLQVRELQQQLENIPEVDAEKVAAIKQAIAQGNYPLDPERIAENLLNLEKALSE